MTLKNITPSPFITCFLEDNSKVHFDVDTQSIKEILDRLTRRLGKTKETLAEERRPWPLLRIIILLTLVLSMEHGYARHCICSEPGQLPLPRHWSGGVSGTIRDTNGRLRIEMYSLYEGLEGWLNFSIPDSAALYNCTVV